MNISTDTNRRQFRLTRPVNFLTISEKTIYLLTIFRKNMNTIQLSEPFSGLSKKRVSIQDLPQEMEATTKNEDGSITKTRSRSVLADDGTKRTEIRRQTYGGIIKVDTDIKLDNIKYNSEEVSVIKKGGKEITTRIRINKDADGNVTKTTIKEIKNRDGTVIYETNVETMGEAGPVNYSSNQNPIGSNENINNFKSQENLTPVRDKVEISVNNEKSILEVPSTVQPGSVECLIQKKYQNDYQLSDEQYKLIREYFDRFQKDELISKQLFKDHLIQVLVEKKKVSASTEDIANALDVIDSDSNDLDFDEFIDFMTLFFANKKNLKTRITNVLNGHQWTHNHTGYLSPEEADRYQAFLYKFYNVKKQPKGVRFSDEMVYVEFAREIRTQLVENVFVVN